MPIPDSQLVDALPDAVCVVDAIGNVLQSNKQFQRKIFSSSDEISVGSQQPSNFVRDILHVEHQWKFTSAMNMIQAKVLLEEDAAHSIALLFTKTLVKGSSKLYPVYRLIYWTLSTADGDDRFVLVGRDPDMQSIDAVVEPGLDSSTELALSNLQDQKTEMIASRVKPFLGHENLRNLNIFDSYEAMTADLIDFCENAPIALHWLSSTGHILWANETELNLLGYTAEEYFGHQLSEFVMPGDQGVLTDIFSKVSAGSTVHDASLKFRARNGSVKYLLIDTNVNFHKNGTFSHTRCFVRDDKSRRLKEEETAASMKLMKKHTESKATFIRNLFHEIRTPMHVLSSFFSEKDPSREDFEDMKHHTGSILGRVDDLTFSTAFEAGEISALYPVPIHLPSVLRSVMDAVQAVEQKAGASVEILLHCQDDLTKACDGMIADLYFRRVLFGLLSNAVKFSPKNGVVDLTVSFQNNDENLENLESDTNKFDEYYNDSNKSIRSLYDIADRTEGNSLNTTNNSPVTVDSTDPSTTVLDNTVDARTNSTTVHPDSTTTTSETVNENEISLKRDEGTEKNENVVSSSGSGMREPGSSSGIRDPGSNGMITFSFRNSTVKPMNVEAARNFFKFYNNADEDLVSDNSTCGTRTPDTHSERIIERGEMDGEELSIRYENAGSSGKIHSRDFNNINVPAGYDIELNDNDNYYSNIDNNDESKDDNTINNDEDNLNDDNNNDDDDEYDDDGFEKNNNNNDVKHHLFDDGKTFTEAFNKNLKNNSRTSRRFRYLKQYEGLGLGLYTAHNMVELMGGKLECSADDNEASFWFTMPYNKSEKNSEKNSRRSSFMNSGLNSPRSSPNMTPRHSWKSSGATSEKSISESSLKSTNMLPKPSSMQRLFGNPYVPDLRMNVLSDTRSSSNVSSNSSSHRTSFTNSQGTSIYGDAEFNNMMNNNDIDDSNSNNSSNNNIKINSSSSSSSKNNNNNSNSQNNNNNNDNNSSNRLIESNYVENVIDLNLNLNNLDLNTVLDASTCPNNSAASTCRDPGSDLESDNLNSHFKSPNVVNFNDNINYEKKSDINTELNKDMNNKKTENENGTKVEFKCDHKTKSESGSDSENENLHGSCVCNWELKNLANARTENRKKSLEGTDLETEVQRTDIRLLVVDDSRICQKVVSRSLSGFEFQLFYASNGQEAIDLLSVQPLQYDAVLMDLRMPVMDGLTAIRQCRNNLNLVDLPIIALTAEVGLRIKDEAMKAGASYFLSKPTASQELLDVLRTFNYP